MAASDVYKRQKPRDLRAPAKVFACAGSYVIRSPSFPSDLGSGAAALSMCLCGAKLALRLHELLRTAGARNSSLLRRKHYRDNDRAATVRYERESGDESARRSTNKPSARGSRTARSREASQNCGGQRSTGGVFCSHFTLIRRRPRHARAIRATRLRFVHEGATTRECTMGIECPVHAELVHVPHLCQDALTKATTLPTRLTTCSLCSPPSPSREATDVDPMSAPTRSFPTMTVRMTSSGMREDE